MMKKPADADIRNLFRRFGGDTGSYQEIQQEYVDDKAKQSWPIVEAMERERAKAPTLRAAAAQQAVAAPASRPVPPVVTRSAPVAEAARPVKQAGSLSALFAKPEPAPAGSLFSKPAGSLFSKSAPAPAPASAPAPVRSLFAGLSSAPDALHQQANNGQQANPVHHSGNDPLNSVFSRLIKPQNPVHMQENGLRNMLGFLKK